MDSLAQDIPHPPYNNITTFKMMSGYSNSHLKLWRPGFHRRVGMVLHGNPSRAPVPATESLHLNGKCISIFTALRSGEILMLSTTGKRVGQQSKLTINNSLKNFKRYIHCQHIGENVSWFCMERSQKWPEYKTSCLMVLRKSSTVRHLWSNTKHSKMSLLLKSYLFFLCLRHYGTQKRR